MGAMEIISGYRQYAQLAAVVLGGCLHMGYFRRGEHHMHGLRYLQTSIAFVTTSTIVLKIACDLSWTSSLQVISSISFRLCLGLSSSTIIYRLFFHPLRRFPGPLPARVTSLWYSSQVTNFDAHTFALGLYTKYGPFVRVGSSDLMIVHPLAVPAIHGAQSKCRKASWYDEDYPRQSIHTS